MNTEALGRVAARQYGSFTARQARAVGLTAKQVEGGARAGLWHRLHRGVYRMAGAPASDLQSLLGAVLAAGPGAMASHRGAAWLWGLTSELCLEVGGPGQHGRLRGAVYHQLPSDVRPIVRRAIPCTDPLLTVLLLAQRRDEALLVAALDRGIANGLFTVAAVEAELGRRSGKGVRGVTMVRSVVGQRLDAEGERTSALESAMDRVIVGHRLPRPERQHPLEGTRYRLDYAWPAVRLAVEVDGYASHAGLEAFGYDRERQNALVLAGWTILRFTWADVRDRPEHVAAQIRQALESSTRSA